MQSKPFSGASEGAQSGSASEDYDAKVRRIYDEMGRRFLWNYWACVATRSDSRPWLYGAFTANNAKCLTLLLLFLYFWVSHQKLPLPQVVRSTPWPGCARRLVLVGCFCPFVWRIFLVLLHSHAVCSLENCNLVVSFIEKCCS
jgi:hypothetical protein